MELGGGCCEERPLETEGVFFQTRCGHQSPRGCVGKGCVDALVGCAGGWLLWLGLAVGVVALWPAVAPLLLLWLGLASAGRAC